MKIFNLRNILLAFVMAAALLVGYSVEAQPEYITCSNGTIVIHVAYPGMCPSGYWEI